ncbi:MAG: repair protein RecO protein [Candidatus Amesbacteria bacterium GW2011_GWB1_47_19]|nr:MAG: repair protein RecO protein [Candidatus Amesbacteria bacterium GW2011_GWA1_44_24]KKU30955.1 MAG: repair protein RecO protein [Candidatus Amesbacteria bacterium GW2011_GWC1_46_24]KKU66618.1 MAG: repair protein RecO protein [Candidatus Amesbacteria bacterium GW2011_GWB1_47_19]OGD05339.1 MAG: DNA repair protein RecO [Candidatus Amesbacteria bacterium RIFOXYB1_FULL_47_13]HBC73206.1 DNA repair protein RecO [Candidatus Amesbacteria bacterium]
MPGYSSEGIVIKRQNFGEAGKIITLFTREKGKINLLAKGIRKTTSKRAGSLELFNRVKISAVKGRGELDTLTEVLLVENFARWRKYLGRITIAYQLCEVVDRLTPDRQPHPEIFEILCQSLAEISVLKNDWKPRTDEWFLEIIRELGFWPKNQDYHGDIFDLIEEIASRRINSTSFIQKLK